VFIVGSGSRSPGRGSRPGHGRYNPRPGQRGVKAAPPKVPGHGKGTSHKSSFATLPQQRAAIALFLFLPFALLAGLGTFFAHGYGLI
jgi:hypothetical protein